MTIFGKRPSEYVSFARLFLGLILVTGVARLALSLGGFPNSTVKWISITAVMWIGVLYYSIRVHSSGFGSYKQLLPICVLQMCAAQVIIVPAIALGILTGHDNIFTAPEYSFGADGKTWFHVGAHLLFGMTVGSLVSWLTGCCIMFAAKKLNTRNKGVKVAARI
jgi:hypothetical protein